MEKTKLLVKEISKYFRDFLETDFHKQRAPKRQIRNQNQDGLLTGMPLKLFPGANSGAIKLLLSQWKDGLLRIKKRQYTAKIPENIIDLIVEKIRIQDEALTVNALLEAYNNIHEYRQIYQEEYETYLEKSTLTIAEVFEKHFLQEFFILIEKSLEKIEAADENTKALMRIEISERIANIPGNEVKDFLRDFFLAEVSEDFTEEFQSLYEHSEVISVIEDFFLNYGVRDLSDDLNEIFNNNKTLDKTEVYLYFYDISFQKSTYPIFFTPVSLSNKNGEWTLGFESPLYINKNALEWIAQEYDSATGKQGQIKSIGDRIIYLSEVEDPRSRFSEILNELCRYFETSYAIGFSDNISSGEIERVSSNLVTISNSCYINLFDKSDEAIVNDYEELLTLSDDSELAIMFEELVENFIGKNPENVESEVNVEWDENGAPEKLVYKSPVPLNEEQRKALIALSKEKCSHLVIQGPPGTGKSHTITAIVCDYILNGKSVLVVSDKEEALDVVETKISQTLNSVRADENFQNPIFRIGKSGSRFNQIVSGTSLSSIKQHYEVMRQKARQIEDTETLIEDELRTSLSNEIAHFEDLSAHEIRGMAELAERLSPIPELLSPEAVLSEDDPIESYNNFIRSIYVLREAVLSYEMPISISIASKSKEDLAKYNRTLVDFKEITRLAEGLRSRGAQLSLDKGSEAFGMLNVLESLASHDTSKENYFWTTVFGEKGIKEISVAEYFNYLEACYEMEKHSESIFSYGKNIPEKTITYFKEFDSDSVAVIREYVEVINQEKLPILGLFFSKKKTDLNKKLRRKFPSIPENPHKDLTVISQVFDFLDFVESKASDFSALTGLTNLFLVFTKNRSFGPHPSFNGKHYLTIIREELYVAAKKYGMLEMCLLDFMDWLRLLSLYATTGGDPDSLNLEVIASSIPKIEKAIAFHEKMLGVENETVCVTEYMGESSEADIRQIIDNSLFNRPQDDFDEYSTYLRLYQKYSGKMRLSVSDYGTRRKDLENMATLRMASVMDSRIVEFYNHHANDVQTLKNVIKAGKKFPKELFGGMKNAFPCIIANIRTYSDFIPLEYQLFDLVIIDEASQVSIAQALPAVFRGKKTVVLGDKMQFSNVKTSQASSETNNKYRKHLESTFTPLWEGKTSVIERLRSFDIKKSVLDFLSHIQNYQVTLRKHFRGYSELISFSNRYFYGNTLQVMKIRGKRLDEILEFVILNQEGLHSGRKLKNANLPEAEFIVQKLEEILSSPKDITVGIITPHTEQQKFILRLIAGHHNKEEFFSRLKLKVMTFDTCQGEERDIIFYSMVANNEDDKLSYIFARDISNAEGEEDKVRLQRLNVGFSRAKEKMYFVLSKPVESFSGGIGTAISHYWNLLRNDKEIGEVDPNSPMESQVLHWILTSKFYLDNKDCIEIIPQFDVGAYLKQLDPKYNHPKYKVDFLFSYKENDSVVNVIIEYDGFKEHFSDLKNVNAGNFDLHYKEGDIYRQKVLESYGYVFLRFNRFNLDPKENPEGMISEKLQEVIASVMKSKISRGSLMQDILNDVESYKNGKKKLCPKCGELKDMLDFIDTALQSGEGRYCMTCKRSTINPQKSQRPYVSSSMPNDEIEALILKAVSNKETIVIFYKGTWRRVRPTELCNDSYMSHSYRCMKGKLPDGEDRRFNVAKISQITS